jgi:hypothetical protein
MDNPNMPQGKVCGCPHHKVIPLLVIFFGLDFLLGSLNVFTPEFVEYSWPVLVILAGGMKLMKGRCKCC